MGMLALADRTVRAATYVQCRVAGILVQQGIEIHVVPVPLCHQVVLLRQRTFDSVCGPTGSRCCPTTSLPPQHVDVLPTVTFNPLVLGNLPLKPHLVGSLVEPLDSAVFEFSLFNQ